MESRLKRKLVVGGTVVATAALAGGAYAATQNTGAPSRQAFLNDVAKRLHVTPGQLNSALKSALMDQLQAAVNAGILTQAQANAIKQRLQQGGVPPFGLPPAFRAPGAPPTFRGPGFFGGPPAHFRGGGQLGAAASYLGLSQAQLLDRLGSGKSLAQIARDQKKSVSGLESAMSSAAKAKLDKLVANKMITSSQEQQILSKLSARIADEVNSAPPKFGRGFKPPAGRWWHGGGPPPPGAPNGASGSAVPVPGPLA